MSSHPKMLMNMTSFFFVERQSLCKIGAPGLCLFPLFQSESKIRLKYDQNKKIASLKKYLNFD